MQGHSERALSFFVRKNKIKRKFSIYDLHKLLDFVISGLLTRALSFFFRFFCKILPNGKYRSLFALVPVP